MNYFSILDAVESSLPDHWTEVADVITDDGHHKVFVFHDNAAITLAWGKDHLEGQSWTEAWSQAGGFPDSKIYGHWFDIRYQGVVIHRDLVLSVDGSRAVLPSGPGCSTPCSMGGARSSTGTSPAPTSTIDRPPETDR